MGITGIIVGLVLVAFGFDRMHTIKSGWRMAAALLPLLGLALTAASILYLCVPGFFNI